MAESLSDSREQRLINNAAQIRLSAAQRSTVNYHREAFEEIRPIVEDLYNKVGEGDDLLARAEAGGKLRNSLRKVRDAYNRILIRRDNKQVTDVKNNYEQEFNMQGWQHTNYVGVSLRWNLKQSLLDAAFARQDSVLADAAKKSLRRANDLAKLEAVIRDSLRENLTMKQAIDLVKDEILNLGVQRQGAIVGKKAVARALLVVRTEMAAIRNISARDAMFEANRLGINERLQKVSVLDDRTRPQSAQMDLQISDEEGRFTYPDGNRYVMGTQPVRWAANDRGTAVPYIDDLDEDLQRRQREADNTNTVVNYRSFEEYARERNLSSDIYGNIYTF